MYPWWRAAALLTGEPQVIGEAKYFGHFVEGQRQTHGCMVYHNGDVYQGTTRTGSQSAAWVQRASQRGAGQAPLASTLVSYAL